MELPTALNPVMILGCGRSGTSIFGELFDGLAGYSYKSEPSFSAVMDADYSTPLAFKVPHEHEAYPAEPGLSFPLKTLLNAQPDFQIFWITRHPLDAICSLKVGIAKNWGHHPRPPDWQTWLSRSLIEQCAHHWEFLNSAGFSQVQSVAYLVKFEDIIARPLHFAREICAYVGVDAELYSDQVERWSARVQNTNNANFVEAETSKAYSRQDHSVRVSRWRENLSEEDANLAWKIVGTTARKFHYEGPERY